MKGMIGIIMKRLISVLLALACVFSLFSCTSRDVKNVAELVNGSVPTKIVTLTTHDDGEEKFNGRYETRIEGNNSVYTYEYQRYQTVADGAEIGNTDFIETVKGTVYYKDGLFCADGVNWISQLPDIGAMKMKFNVEAKHLKKPQFSDDKKVLTATVSAKNIEKMFGVAINADENGATVEIEHDGIYVRKITISYTQLLDETGENTLAVTIQTSFSYAPEDIVFPGETVE